MAKILVLDDRPAICDLIEHRLAENGHEVRTACAGDQAIDLGYLFEPELLIADWDLKGEYDGLEVCEAVQYANKKIKMILMTGNAARNLDSRLERQSLFSMLQKPFCIDDLIELVNLALSTKTEGSMPTSFSAN